MRRWVAGGVFALLALGAVGCGPTFTRDAEHGIVFYCPGAGNLDNGDDGLRRGLAAAGFHGQVASIGWTWSFNPAIDQALKVNARLAGERLAGHIQQYIDRYPGEPVTIIGLSAGTGIAIWACEHLKPGYEVDNVVLLSGSLSYDYDISKALRHLKGKIYNYYSNYDLILTSVMKPFGTIDGKFTDGVGAVEMRPPHGAERVVNIPWEERYKAYGYLGGHTDVTDPRFVRYSISAWVMQTQPASPPPSRVAATQPARVPPAARPR